RQRLSSIPFAAPDSGLFHAVAPPVQACAEGPAVVGRLLGQRGRLLLLLGGHLHLVLLDTLGVARAADHGAGEAAEHRSRAPVPVRRYGGADHGARDGPDGGGGAGAGRRAARHHAVCRRNVGRARIKTGLVHRPEAALVPVLALLLGRLAVLRVGVDGGIGGRRLIAIGPAAPSRERPLARLWSGLAALDAQSERRQESDCRDAPQGRQIPQQFDRHGFSVSPRPLFRSTWGRIAG